MRVLRGVLVLALAHTAGTAGTRIVLVLVLVPVLVLVLVLAHVLVLVLVVVLVLVLVMCTRAGSACIRLWSS